MGDGFEPFAFMIKAPGAFVGLGVMLAAITFIGVLTERRKRSAQ
jgi:electron transport complex protein RnfE